MWEVEGGIILQNFDSYIDVKWTKASKKNYVKYKVLNHNTKKTDSTVMQVNVKPTIKPYIDGKKTVCVGSFELYAFEAYDKEYNPSWEVVNGAIDTRLDYNTVKVQWSEYAGEGMIILKNSNPNVCAGNDTLRVTIIAPPPLEIFGRKEICVNQYEIYSVKELDNTDYFWTTPNGELWGNTKTTSINVRWDKAGVDSISVIVHNRTTGCTRRYTKAVMVNNFVKAKLAPFKPICVSGEKIVLTGGTPEGGTYSCGDLVKNNVFNVPFAGVGNHLITYSYTTAKGNCVSSDTATLRILPIPPRPSIFYESEILYTNLNKGIQWFLGGVAIPGATKKTHEPTESGYYSVKGVNEIGCYSPKSDSIYVDLSSVKEVGTAPIQIIKNEGNVSISSAKHIAKINVYNLIGTSVFSGDINATNCKIDTQAMIKGVYFVKIICEDGTAYYKKLIL